MKLPCKRVWVGMACITGILLILVSFETDEWHYSSICRACGKSRSSREVHLLWWVVMPHHQEEDTRMSLALTTNGMVTVHDHDWLFAQGGSKSVSCAIGGGRHLSASVKSERLIRFISDAWRFGQLQTSTNMLAVAMTPNSSHDALWLIADYPQDGIESQREFLEWMGEHREEFESRAKEIRKAGHVPFVISSVANAR